MRPHPIIKASPRPSPYQASARRRKELRDLLASRQEEIASIHFECAVMCAIRGPRNWMSSDPAEVLGALVVALATGADITSTQAAAARSAIEELTS